MKTSLGLLFCFILLSQTACKAIFDNNGDLLSSTQRSSHSLSTMRNALSNSRYTAKYAVKTYRIVYETEDSNGDSVEASGLLAVPQKSSSRKSPLVVHLHDTITKNNFAPSYLYQASNNISKAASLGYIVIAPDYIGYGKSNNETHPYLHEKTLVSSTIDMMKASKQWLKNHNRPINKQVFIEGYSEGGYAAMATHKKIEKDYRDDFTITASVPGGGPYDLSATVQTLIDREKLEDPVSIAFIIKAYNDIYSSDLLNAAIKPAFRSIVRDDINNGSYDTSELNDLLGYQTHSFLKDSFIQDMRDGTETRLSKNLRRNNLYDWKPKTTMRIVHGEDDKVIPYDNAVKTVDEMIANGATNIELIACDVSPFKARHDICSVFSYNYAIKLFNDLAYDL